MLMNICLLRSRLPFSCRGNCNLKRPVPVPRYPMTSLDLILMGFHLHAPALKLRYVHAPLLRSTDGEFPRKKKYNIWCRCHRRTSVLRSLLRQRLDLPVLPLNAHTSCLFVHTHTWAVVRALAAVPHLALALVSRDDREH